MKKHLAILAYGSLITEPGSELDKVIIDKINCITPFSVEYSRMSKTRDFAPTLVPDPEGAPVNATLLLLNENTSLEDAKNMLWRRETRNTKSNYKEKVKPGQNDVQVKIIENYEGIDTVIYTSIASNLGLNSPPVLAKLAMDSILNQAGEKKIDGVRYLLNAKQNGIVTPKSEEYENCILEATQTRSLEEAITKLDSLRPKRQQQKIDDDEFEKKVVEISDLICDYGLKKTLAGKKLDLKTFKQFRKKNNKKFIINCHEGFKKGQDEVVKLLIEYEEKKTVLNSELKNFKLKKDKIRITDLTTEIEIIEDRENILRHLIDTIAWQLIGGQLYITRRLYQGVEGKKRLLKSNIKSVIEVAEDLNKEPEDFALITDLSSYIQTADILLRKGGNTLAFVEVKEGTKNQEILEVIHKIFDPKDQTPPEKIMQSVKWDKKSVEQFERNLKQVEKMSNLTAILKNDEGTDSSGRQIKIITPKEGTPRFEKELHELFKQLQKNNIWAYQVIEGCLHVAMYKGPLKFAGPFILKGIGEHEGGNIQIVNFLNVLESLHKPLLLLPFPKNFLFDILFNRVSLYFMINVDKYLLLFPDYGLTATWMSRKETMKAVEGQKGSGMFIHKERGIKVTQNESKNEMYLNHGIFTKMFYEHIYPSYTAYGCNYLLSYDGDDKNLTT